METTNTFLDIGANIGQTFDQFLSQDEKYDGWNVWCFEPSPRHLPGLMETAKKYGDRYNIRIYTCGVWDRDGMSLLWQKNDPMGDSMFVELETHRGVTNIDHPGYVLIVPVKSLRKILESCIGNVVVKLDCEGSEYHILEDLLIGPHLATYGVSDVYVEFHHIGEPHRSPDDIAKDFEARGLPLKQWMF